MPSSDPTSAVIRSSYRASLKELQRAYQLHLGNSGHIIKAVFGPLLDVETLRRAGLLGILNTPTHAFDHSLRPTNIAYVKPPQPGTTTKSYVQEDDHGIPNFSKSRSNVSIIGKKGSKPTAQTTKKSSKGKREADNEHVSPMSDGVALAHLLRMFYEPAKSNANKGKALGNPYHAAASAINQRPNNDAKKQVVAQQMEVLAKSFELLKRLRESTHGYPQPTEAKKSVKDSDAPSLPVIEVAPPSADAATPCINKCVLIVTGPSHFNDKDLADINITGKEEERSIYTRIVLPESGSGAIRTMHNLFVPVDPFHGNMFTDKATVSFAAELAFIEALAASNNATKEEIENVVPASVKHSVFEVPAEHQATVVEDPTSGVVRWSPPHGTEPAAPASTTSSSEKSIGQYYSTSAYSRSTLGHLISDNAKFPDSYIKFERSFLAPTIIAEGQKLKVNSSPDDATEPKTGLDILNCEFGGVRAPFSAARMATGPTTDSKFPLISLPRPIANPDGASLVPFGKVDLLPLETPWYQLATPALFASSKAVQPIVLGKSHAETFSLLPKGINSLAVSALKGSTSTKSLDAKAATTVALLSLLSTTTTTIVNGILSVSVTTTYVGVNGNSFSQVGDDEEGSEEPKEKHVFQYRVTLRNISGEASYSASQAAKVEGDKPGSSADTPVTLEEVRSSQGATNASSVGVDIIAISRHWAFVDAVSGSVAEVVGPGLVGNSPRLEPGQCFTYESGTTMSSSQGGYMRGSIQCIATTHDHNSSLVMVIEARKALQTNISRRRAGNENFNIETDEDVGKLLKLLKGTYKHTQSHMDAPISATALRKE